MEVTNKFDVQIDEQGPSTPNFTQDTTDTRMYWKRGELQHLPVMFSLQNVTIINISEAPIN